MALSRRLIVTLLLAPSAASGDATIRYKNSQKMAMPIPGQSPDSTSVTYMKGDKGAIVSSAQTMIADFTKQTVTIVDTKRRKYTVIPVAEYGAKMASAMPGMPASAALGSMKMKCESKDAGPAEAIQGVQTTELDQTCSMEITLPSGLQAAVGNMGMHFTTRTWFAAPSEKLRVPALWQLSGFELWQRYFINPGEMLEKMIPGGMAEILKGQPKNPSAVLRQTMEMYGPSIPGMNTDPNTPMMKMTQEVVELSTAPLADSLFETPSDYTAVDFGDLWNGITQSLLHPADNPPTMGSGLTDASVKAYVPMMMPLSQTEMVTKGDVHGMVELLVTVGPKGNVENAEALSGPDELRQPAIDAVRHWTYRPVLRNGAPVVAYTDASVNNVDWQKQGASGSQFTADMLTAPRRRMELAQALPRSKAQVLADLEQEAGGSNSRRRYDLLSQLTAAALAAGEDEKAAAYAKESLAAAEQDRRGWNYGNAVHDGHMTLGLVALRRNDVATAREQLLAAGKTPGSPQLNSFGPNMALASELLKSGDRETVLQYFAECRSFWKLGETQLDTWSATVRKGDTPVFGASIR